MPDVVRLLAEGFAVGLVGGTACLATCVPVLLPYLLAEGERPRWDGAALGSFLLGRLAGYLSFALLAWLLGVTLLEGWASRALLVGAAYLALGGLLIVYGFRRPPTACAAAPAAGLLARVRSRWPTALPAVLGLLTGLSLCPPFLLAVTRAADSGGLAGSLAFFAAFYCATSLYLIPLPFAGLLRRRVVVRTVGRLAAGVVGAYFAYLGLIALLGGLTS
jgi:hypothetical protein